MTYLVLKITAHIFFVKYLYVLSQQTKMAISKAHNCIQAKQLNFLHTIFSKSHTIV